MGRKGEEKEKGGREQGRRRGGGGGVAGVRTLVLLKTAGDDHPEIWIFEYLFS